MDGLRLEGVRHAYDREPVVDGVSLTVRAGEIVCLLGPSGCGKSTTLRLAAGLERLQEGSVSIGGRAVAGGGRDEPPETRGVGLVFQDYALFPHLDVLRNVTFGLRGVPAEERRARGLGLLERLGIARHAASYPHALSGGEQQRVALARALAPKPKIMLLDEPYSGLDIGLRDAVRDDTLAVLKEQGTATLLVTHDPEEAMRMADRIAVMRAGRIVQDGPPDDVYRRPASRFVATFFGELNRLEGVVRADRCVETAAGVVAAPLLEPGRRVDVLLRPEAVRLDNGANGAAAEVVAARSLGAYALVDVRLPGGAALRCRIARRLMPMAGQHVGFRLDPAQVFVFPTTEERGSE
jgi:iron(III) transport system ATP-binding protein